MLGQVRGDHVHTIQHSLKTLLIVFKEHITFPALFKVCFGDLPTEPPRPIGNRQIRHDSVHGATGDVRKNIAGFETTQGLVAGIAPPPTALWAGLARMQNRVDRRWRVLAGVIDPVLGVELHIAVAAVVDA